VLFNISNFDNDFSNLENKLSSIICKSSFLVIGGAGSIGHEVSKLIFKYNPIKLHVIDISENNLVELVRDIRSTYGYIKGNFLTLPLYVESAEYNKFIESDGEYDFVINLSALKHVRSEKDPYTLMRLIKTNILNVEKILNESILHKSSNFFSVSTDKAANPVNIMGASKRIMELLMLNKSQEIIISSARFANVLFSDGSLMYSFNKRFEKNQPIVAPYDIKRFFISKQEAAKLCLISAIFANTGEIYFPKLNPNSDLISFKTLAIKYVEDRGLKIHECFSEEEARVKSKELNLKKEWPCYFSKSETTGEKLFEEFFSSDEKIDLNRFNSIGIIQNKTHSDNLKVQQFLDSVKSYSNSKVWKRRDLIKMFEKVIPNFNHIEKDKFLDEKM